MKAKRQIEAEVAAAVPMRNGSLLNWQEIVERFIAAKTARSARYLEGVRSTADRLSQKHGWKAASDVRAEHIAAMPGFSGRVILAIVRHAARLGQPVDARTVKSAAQRAPGKPQADAMPEELVASLIAAADRWHLANGTMAHIISVYGHRAESLIELTCGAIDVPAGTITLRVKNGKTVRHRLIAATMARVLQLIQGRAPTDALFVGHLGRPWKNGLEFSAWWGHVIAKAVDRPAGILSLRQFGISRMFSLGLDAKTISDITGHRTVSLLQNTYARSDERRRNRAVNALEAAVRDTTVTPDDSVSY